MSLEFRNISHQYASGKGGHDWHLSELSLAIEPGEIVSLFGPSGCGKTTLLRLAAGLEPLQRGEIYLFGQCLSDQHMSLPPEKRPVGFVFQDHVLFPHLSVLDNILFGLTHMNRQAARKEAAIRLDAMHLAELAGRYPHELSGGQQQRVALARALARRPKAMLLDEPFASIGAALRRTLQEDVRRFLRQDGMANIFVTHDPEEALMMGDRVALMHQGKLLEVATAQELFEKPKTLQGAMMFSGHQQLSGVIKGGMISTSFGTCLWPDRYGAIPRENTSVQLAISTHGLTLVKADSSQIRIIDRRFSHPHHLCIIEHSEFSERLRVYDHDHLPIGTPVTLSYDLDAIKFIQQEPHS